MGRQARSELQIVVTGRDNGAEATLRRVRDEANKTNESVSGIGKGGTSGLSDLGNTISGLTDSFGKLSSAVQNPTQAIGLLGRTITAAGAEGEAAVSGLGGAFAGLAGPVGIAIAAVVALIAILTALIALGLKAANDAANWANAVDNIHQATGATAEFASTLAAIGQIAGVSTDQIAQSFGALARNIYTAGQQMEEIARSQAKAQADAARQIQQIQSDSADRIVDIQEQGARRIAAIAEQTARARARAAREEERATEQHEQRLSDIAEQAADRRESIEESHVDAMANIADQQAKADQTLADRRVEIAQQTADQIEKANEQHAQQLADIEGQAAEQIQRTSEQHAQQLADIAERSADRRKSIEESHVEALANIAERQTRDTANYEERRVELEQDASAKIEDERRQLSERLTELDESHIDKLSELEQQLADKREDIDLDRVRRAQRVADQILGIEEDAEAKRESIQSRINNAQNPFEERALLAELEGYNKRVEAKKKQVQTNAAIEEQAQQTAEQKQLAKLQERIDKENAIYAKQTEKLKNQQQQRERDIEEALAKQRAKLQRDYTEREADLARAIEKENTQRAKQIADLEEQRAKAIEKENAQYAKQISDLEEQRAKAIERENKQSEEHLKAIQENLAKQLVELQKNYIERELELSKAIERENKQYAKQIADLEEQRAKAIERENKQYAERIKLIEENLAQQVSDNAAAQAQIAADIAARIQDEQDRSTKAMQAVQERLNSFLEESAQRLPPVVQALADLGIKFEDIEKLAPDERLDLILRKLAEMPDSMQKAAIATILFGRAGKDLNDLAELYSTKTLPEWQRQQSVANRLLDQDGVNAAKRFQIEQRTLEQNFGNLWKQLGEELIPVFTDLYKTLNEFITNHGPALANAIHGIALVIGGLVSAITTLVHWFDVAINKAAEFIKKVGEALNVSDKTAGAITAGAINLLVPGLGNVVVGSTYGYQGALPPPATQVPNATGSSKKSATPSTPSTKSVTNNFTLNVATRETDTDVKTAVKQLQMLTR